jgi:hypothetical protein
MKWLASASFLFLFLVAPAEAQSPQKQGSSPPVARPAPPTIAPAAFSPQGQTSSPGIHISAGELTATPEMWFYEQSLRQYNDPKWVLRQKAEFRSAERARRIETLRWYGFSSARPTTGADPIHGYYGPRWTSAWSIAAPTIVVASEAKPGRSQ